MPDLTVTVKQALAVPFAATPTIGFDLAIVNANPSEQIHTIILRCQLQIEATRRSYGADEQDRLRDLFGAADRWGQTLRPMLWTHASIVVPAFTGNTSVLLPVACSFDFNVAATKYFAALSGGEIPLCLMFSGTVFYADRAGTMQVAPISWDKETRFRLPVPAWKEMMEHYYPNTAWLCLRRDVFEKLHQYKVGRGIPTWEETVESILAHQTTNSDPGPDRADSMSAALAALRWGAEKRR